MESRFAFQARNQFRLRSDPGNGSAIFDWQADFVDRVFLGFPLHHMKPVDLVAVEAIPDVFTGEGGHRPMVALADHLLSDMIFPFLPVHLGI